MRRERCFPRTVRETYRDNRVAPAKGAARRAATMGSTS